MYPPGKGSLQELKGQKGTDPRSQARAPGTASISLRLSSYVLGCSSISEFKPENAEQAGKVGRYLRDMNTLDSVHTCVWHPGQRN